MKHPKLQFGQKYDVWYYADEIQLTEDLQHIRAPVRLYEVVFEQIRENIVSPRAFKFRIEGRYIYFLSQDKAGVHFQSRCGQFDFEIDDRTILPHQREWIKNNAVNMTDPFLRKGQPKPEPLPPKPRPFRIPGDGAWLGDWEATVRYIDCQELLTAIDEVIALNKVGGFFK